VPGYGDDEWTQKACARLRELFETDAQVFFVFNGTAANALALAQLCQPYHAVIAHAFSHVEEDEAGAPALFSGGAKIVTADTALAKLTPDAVDALAKKGRRGVHHVKARALSITQATELGTVYTPGEVGALTEMARRHGLKVHMDGARFANALATLQCSPADLSRRAGVDVLCLGGVKNGLAVGEAVLFFSCELAAEFEWRVKQAGHLNSKMRLVTAPWLALLEGDVWLSNARHANAMARRLSERITNLPGVRLLAPVQANGVFVELPAAVQARLREKGWRFYTFLGETGCRLMCAWDTTPETVDRFAADIAAMAMSR
jgi:threonine aldolase